MATLPVSGARVFEGSQLLQIAMPMGGIGAGCVCLNGYGGLQDFSLKNRPDITALPDGHGVGGKAGFAVLHVKGETTVTRLLEGPLPPEKLYDQGLQSQGYRHAGYEGLPRFNQCSFEARYPFGTVRLEDAKVPLQVEITGWSPFIPGDDVNSGLPCAFLDYRLTNPTSETIDFEFSYHLSHLAVGHGRWDTTRNAVLEGGPGGGVFLYNTLPATDENHGSAALYTLSPEPRVKAMWFRGGWFDSISALWRELSTGTFTPNDGQGPVDPGNENNNGGSLLISGSLAPGESVTYPIILAWHFPNSNEMVGTVEPDPGVIPLADCGPSCDCGPERATAWRPFYAGRWNDAREVALYAAEEYESLRGRTSKFTDTLFSSTLPAEVLDAIASNLAILKSPTVLRQENGNVWGWEGCFTQSGCCPGSCTHVWNYAQALPHLFPALERTLREQELIRSRDERGHINFRAALPDGPTHHNYHAAADGQLGGILKLYRDFHISGNLEWLSEMYPHAKASLDFCIDLWDPNHQGGLFEPHHNTYDIEFWGPDGMCGSIYVGALAAMASLARELFRQEDAEHYEALSRRAAEFLDRELFNGEYYQQRVQWQDLRDQSFARQIEDVDESSSEMLRLLAAEGPKYQYGSGCLSDGIIGDWMARFYGVETTLNRDHVRATLNAIFTHNFREDLSEHACTQRPGYALGHEAGLLLCSWPRGGKPTLPFVYSDEVWPGIEYQVAAHLISEGLVNQGTAIVKACRARFEGHVRNPFNEYECGNYYARSMASYALLQAFSGFRYSAASQTLWFAPRVPGSFKTFFATASAWGSIALNSGKLTISVIEGDLEIRHLHLAHGHRQTSVDWEVTVRQGEAMRIEAWTP